MAEMKTAFEQAHPGVQVRAEASGSQVAARKVSEYEREADLVLVADWHVIDDLLRPAHAAWNVGFASNEIVLAYSESSRHAAEIDGDNWPDVLLRDDVRVARVDENLAPIGYQTLLVWKLAERHYAKRLAGRWLHDPLKKRASGNLVRADVVDVLPLLGTEADYAFIYRSVAQGHNLPFVELPPEINLSDPAQAKFYAQASVAYHNGTETVKVTGQPIVYGATIPTDAPNALAAEAFLALLWGNTGQEILRSQGFRPLVPARGLGMETVPDALRGLVEPGKPET
jgi:molybdate/tungstate transport system substrate-binding protein